MDRVMLQGCWSLAVVPLSGYMTVKFHLGIAMLLIQVHYCHAFCSPVFIKGTREYSRNWISKILGLFRVGVGVGGVLH